MFIFFFSFSFLFLSLRISNGVANVGGYFRKLASGRSARLPPTPTQIQNSNVRHLVDVSINNTSGYVGDANAIDTFAPNLAVTTTQMLDSLSERERQIILDVLNRDEEVRQRDGARIV